MIGFLFFIIFFIVVGIWFSLKDIIIDEYVYEEFEYLDEFEVEKGYVEEGEI